MIKTLLAGLLAFVPLSFSAQPQADEDLVSFESAHLVTVPNDFVVFGKASWSPNGRRVAYIAWKDKLTYPAIDDEVFDSDFLFLERPVFSTDSEHVVFRAGERSSKTKEKWWPFLDGKKGKKQDWIGKVQFRPGTDELVYWTQPGAKIQKDGAYNRGKQILISGKKKGKKWADAGSLFPMAFSADGSVAATSVLRGYEWQLLLVDKKGQELTDETMPMIMSIALSPDGSRWATAVQGMDMSAYSGKGGATPTPGAMPKQISNIRMGDEVLGSAYDGAGTPVFSADGAVLAFTFAKGDKMGVATSAGLESKPEFDHAFAPVFDPTGNGLAFVGNLDGTLDPVLRWFSQAGQMLIGGTNHVIRVDQLGQEVSRSKGYEAIDSVTFSKDGAQLAFAAKDKDGWAVHFGDTVSDHFDQVGELHFDETGTRLAFGTRKGQELAWAVLDLVPVAGQ